MAQVFETAVFEAGELRIGHADRTRLEKAQEATEKEFHWRAWRRARRLRGRARPASDADRAYVATWALASYLMFDRRVLGSAGLDEFVKAVNEWNRTMTAFSVGQPPAVRRRSTAGCDGCRMGRCWKLGK